MEPHFERLSIGLSAPMPRLETALGVTIGLRWSQMMLVESDGTYI